MNFVCLFVVGILTGGKIRCGKRRRCKCISRTTRQRENQDFQGISRKLILNMGQFLSVRTEQPSKVCSEERLKIKVSDDFSQSRLSNFN